MNLNATYPAPPEKFKIIFRCVKMLLTQCAALGEFSKGVRHYFF